MKLGSYVIGTPFLAAASHVNFKYYLAVAALFVPSFLKSAGTDVIPSQSFSQSDRRGAATKKKRLSFPFSFVFFPQLFFLLHSTNLFFLLFYFSGFSLLPLHQGRSETSACCVNIKCSLV